MTAWLRRNARPVALILIAAAVVIAGFELIDAVSRPGPVAGDAPADDELEGVASLAGLIKVLLFVVVGGAITAPLRRRLRADSES